MSIPAQGAEGAETMTAGRRQMAEGCCSAVSPCSHQRRDPYSLCDICLKANGLAERITCATPRTDSDEGTAGDDATRALLNLTDGMWRDAERQVSLLEHHLHRSVSWQPVSEAPSDGTAAWIRYKDGTGITVAYLNPEFVESELPRLADAWAHVKHAPATPPGVPDSVRAALKPFADAAAGWDASENDGHEFADGETIDCGESRLTVGDLRRARTLLSAHPAGQSTGQGADIIAATLADFQRRNGYHRPEIEELLTEFGELLLSKVTPAPDSPLTGPVGVEDLRGLIGEVADAVFAIGRATLSEQQVDRAYTAAERLLDYRDRNLSAARPAALEAQGAWSLEPEGKPIQGFSNRAGETDTDDAIAFELESAGIEVYRLELLRKTSGEVKTSVRGELHGWSFTRAWRYWVAEGPGIELAAADVLHAAHPDTVRVNGHCGGPSPREQNNGLAIGSYHVDSPAGLKGLADTIKAIVARSAPPSSGQGGR